MQSNFKFFIPTVIVIDMTADIRRVAVYEIGISVVDAAETSGIGTKVIANEATTAGTGALDQFVGKSGAGTLVVKQNIDAVTGATVSTKGVTKGVNAALAAAEAMN